MFIGLCSVIEDIIFHYETFKNKNDTRKKDKVKEYYKFDQVTNTSNCLGNCEDKCNNNSWIKKLEETFQVIQIN